MKSTGVQEMRGKATLEELLRLSVGGGSFHEI